MDFETGVILGRELARISDHEIRISKLEGEVSTVKALGVRAALLLLLWLGAIATNLPAERVGTIAASFLQAWSKS
jgi:hypothetical protein